MGAALAGRMQATEMLLHFRRVGVIIHARTAMAEPIAALRMPVIPHAMWALLLGAPINFV